MATTFLCLMTALHGTNLANDAAVENLEVHELAGIPYNGAVSSTGITMFENAEISMEELPRADTVSWLGMDDKFLRRLMTRSVIALIILVIGIGALHTVLGVAFEAADIDMSFAFLWLIVPLIAIPLLVWPAISVPRMAYAIRDKDILYKSGVIWQTVTAVPFNRIQHVEKSSTPLDRRFNLATLQLFTAGGSGSDLKIHGLPARTAEDLRVFIIEKVGKSVERA